MFEQFQEASTCVRLLLEDPMTDPYKGTDNAFEAMCCVIDYDVSRGESEYEYFATKDRGAVLRDILKAYISQHRSIGYVQGMSDTLEPLLAVLHDPIITYACFVNLMARIHMRFERANEVAIQASMSSLRALLLALDPPLMDFLHEKDSDHMYFAYRWFLLDFKRDVHFADVFYVWESIWASKTLLSHGFNICFAFAILQMFRKDILALNTSSDVFAFFNKLDPLDPKPLLRMAGACIPALHAVLLLMGKLERKLFLLNKSYL